MFNTLRYGLGLWFVGALFAQPPPLHWKTQLHITQPEKAGTPPRRQSGTQSHMLIQFAAAPDNGDLANVQKHGVALLEYVPDFAFTVSVKDGSTLAGLGLAQVVNIEPPAKISPLVSAAGIPGQPPGFYVAEFFPDVGSTVARSVALASGVAVHENPILASRDLLVYASLDQVHTLSQWDEVEYIFPASQALVNGDSIETCISAVTTLGPVGQAVPTIGDGWDGPGNGSAALSYAFGDITPKLAPDLVTQTLAQAFAEWSKYAAVTFTETTDPSANRTIAILFASGAHGDGYPFDGPGGILAHTFYPAPVNPESIAGDMHFDADENWHVGTDVDLFSVALHEIGHALGLGHSDDPEAVMYPYYKQVTGLSQLDTAAVLELYAAATATVTPVAPPVDTPEPLTVTVASPPTTVNAVTVALAGTFSGGTGAVTITWATDQDWSGDATVTDQQWSIAAIPLSTGPNAITITATDTVGALAAWAGTITESSSSAASGPALQITAPANGTPVTTADSTYTLTGTASDSTGISNITWDNGQGLNGTATGTTSWSTGPVALIAGQNVITITAFANSGLSASQTAYVTQSVVAASGSPSLTILSPASTIVSTTGDSIVISGTASASVTQVTWQSSTGDSGSATGISTWSTPAITLYLGSTTITIWGYDAAGNSCWRSLTVWKQ